MPTVTTVVVGAGHSGLAMSRCLTERSIDHVVLERRQVANSWRTQRWDSLRLLTPNWMTRLPGWEYDGDDPDGFLTGRQVADLITDYGDPAPVRTGTEVVSIGAVEGGFEVVTDQEVWRARTAVVAAGLTRGVAPAVADALPSGLVSLHAIDYRNPDQLPDGGVLVVGPSSSGVQIAEELQRSGRPVTLATGEHVRLPRRYRDRDILWWMEASGILDERWDEVDDIVRARNLPSMQLVGGARTLDLNTLQAGGVRVTGRLAGIRDSLAQFSGSLPNVCALADLKLGRLLKTIDEYAGGTGERFEPTRVPDAPLGLDLSSGEIRSVVWATGIKPDHGCLRVPVLDRGGRLQHDGGVTACPGLYVMGLPVLRRRRSTFIGGAALDAVELADHLAGHLAGQHAGSPGINPLASHRQHRTAS
ncbi:NAD(P)-binding domain-containing protein [Nocardioides sp. GCM10027113]|uniref:NAD(P)-binding domain-containing protein n=1 Tax=unclassified Nocardioides TaxID=2615069 RepID=UPI00360D82B0